MDIKDLREELATVLKLPGDSDRLVRNFIDWLIRRVEPANIGIWMPDNDRMCCVAHYVHTGGFPKKLRKAVQQNFLNLVVHDGIVYLNVATTQAKSILTKAEIGFFKGSEVYAFSCTYLNIPQAVVVLYREPNQAGHTGFTWHQKDILVMAELVFSHALASVDHEGKKSNSPSREKKDPADWWKEGGEPPC